MFNKGPWGKQDGHLIEDEGVSVVDRDTISFEGAGVTAADSGGKTVVTIPGGSGNVFDEIVLTPKASSISGAEGTIFYCSSDNGVYVATE
jgi:hypothetical protein